MHLSVNLQCRQSRAWIPWWLTLSKPTMKSIWTILASCPHFNTLYKVWDTENSITSTETFSICELGGRKHTSTFHKPSKMNRHQTLKHLYQNRCIWSLIGNRRGRWTFWNWGEIGLSSESGETTQKNKPPKCHNETKSQNVNRPLQKEDIDNYYIDYYNNNSNWYCL